MREYLPYILCIAIILYGIFSSIKEGYESQSIYEVYKKVIYYFSTLATFMIVIFKLNVIYELILKVSRDYLNLEGNFFVYKIVGLVIVYLLLHFIIYSILYQLSRPLLNKINNGLDNNNIVLTLFSAVFGFFKGFIIIIITMFCIFTYNSLVSSNKQINIFNNIKAYNDFARSLAEKRNVLPVNNLDEYGENVIIYYNGVTLDEGVKSNEEINTKANMLVRKAENDKEKAEALYSWIGSNIDYDFDKAEKALNNENLKDSGAISAWESRTGICFDYACLYVAMAKSVGLNVRLVTGSAFDGSNYGPHAWNQVYIEEENRWINLDPTFYKSGNYFDNNDFSNDHIEERVAGEW